MLLHCAGALERRPQRTICAPIQHVSRIGSSSLARPLFPASPLAVPVHAPTVSAQPFPPPPLSPSERITSLTLYISQKIPKASFAGYITLSSKSCTQILRSLHFTGTAVDTLSSVQNGNAYGEEAGVMLKIHKVTKPQVRDLLWPRLLLDFGLTCAYVEEQNFAGCILDWLQPSVCPGSGSAGQ